MSPPEGGSRAGPPGEVPRRLRRVAWAMRGPALLLAGPASGALMVADLFGMSGGLIWAAAGMLLFGAGLLGVLARAEWRRG